MQRSFNTVSQVQSETATHDPPKQGVVISGVAGRQLKYVDGNGTHVFKWPAAVAGGTILRFPFILPVRMWKVFDVGTSAPDVNLLLLQ